VARLLRSSGKSDKGGNEAAVRQWQEWQGEVTKVARVTTRPLRGSDKAAVPLWQE